MKQIPSVSARYASNGSSTMLNELGMRAMQERAFERRGEQYLLIKSPPASGKSRALMFIALDKLHNQGLKQAIVVVPEKKEVRSNPLTRKNITLSTVCSVDYPRDHSTRLSKIPIIHLL